MKLFKLFLLFFALGTAPVALVGCDDDIDRDRDVEDAVDDIEDDIDDAGDEVEDAVDDAND